MHSFEQKPLEVGTTLGERLSHARLAKKLSLTDVATILSIQEKYIQALEQSTNQILPGEGYARSWIKKYASYLGLDGDACVEQYQQEKTIQHHVGEPAPKLHRHFKWQSWLKIVTGPRALQRLGVVLAAVVLLGYLIWFLIQTFQAPTISFDQAIKDQKTSAPSITISGKTEIGTQVWFNDKDIMVDDRGGFRQDIPLSDGLNIITIHAKKKHSREFEATIQVVRETPPETAATSTPTTISPKP